MSELEVVLKCLVEGQLASLNAIDAENKFLRYVSIPFFFVDTS